MNILTSLAVSLVPRPRKVELRRRAASERGYMVVIPGSGPASVLNNAVLGCRPEVKRRRTSKKPFGHSFPRYLQLDISQQRND